MRSAIAAMVLAVVMAGCGVTEDTVTEESPEAESDGFTTEFDDSSSPSPDAEPPPAPAPVAPPAEQPPPPPPPADPPPPQSTSFANCTEARDAGAAPVYRGDAGYGTHLDRDGDGVGCE